MIPTAWTVLFDGDRFSPETERVIRHSPAMERFREKLRSCGDLSFAHAAENALEQSFRHTLDVSLLECLLPAWERHPQFQASLNASRDGEDIVLLGLGEHEVVSTHHPRIEVVGPGGTLASFEPELRIELRLQSATLRIEGGAIVSATIGACSGSASIHLDDRELAMSERGDIRFPSEIPVSR